MHSMKIIRIFLTSFLLVSISFSSFVSPSVQADTTSSATLSPAITAKLDAFVEKVKALRPKYNSDENYNIFLDTLGSKIVALKPRYGENPLILAVLDRLSSGVKGLKIQADTGNVTSNTVTAVSPASSPAPAVPSNVLFGQRSWKSFIEPHNKAIEDRFPTTMEDYFNKRKQNGWIYTENAWFTAERVVVPDGKIVSFDFRAEAALDGHRFDNGYNNGSFVLSISEKPGDFSMSNTGGCISSGPSLYISTDPVGVKNMRYYGTTTFRTCLIIPGRTYYYNIKHIDQLKATRNGGDYYATIKGPSTCSPINSMEQGLGGCPTVIWGLGIPPAKDNIVQDLQIPSNFVSLANMNSLTNLLLCPSYTSASGCFNPANSTNTNPTTQANTNPSAASPDTSAHPDWSSGSGHWVKFTGGFQSSPPPPTCNSAVVENGSCVVNSACNTTDGNRFLCR
ncbi:MAG: hypothetical protein PHH16_03755 [Candidatus Gracilibacteria bacterium]|nr:hypothetical protein [Candidatus Gracilibacteria bacterium]